MNVSFITTVESAPDIDVGKIKDLFKSIREGSGSLDVEFDLNLHESVESLFISSVSSGDELRSGLVTLLALLQSNSLKTTLQSWLDQAHARSTPEKRERAVEVVWQHINREVNNYRASMEHLSALVTECAGNLERVNLSARANVLSVRLKADISTLGETSAKKIVEQAQLLADIALLDETIDALDKLGWTDLRMILPTEAELAVVVADPTKVAAIMVGINRLGKLLEVVGGAMAFREAIRKRDELRMDRDRLEATIQYQATTQQEHVRREGCVRAVLNLHYQKQALRRELLRVPAVLEHFGLQMMLNQDARDFAPLVKAADECAAFVGSAYAQVR